MKYKKHIYINEIKRTEQQTNTFKQTKNKQIILKNM